MNPWTPLLLSHVVAAVTSVLLGGLQVWRKPKGDSSHKVVGRVWVAAIAWTAVTSFWIRDINGGSFSWLHVLSVVTLVTVTLGIVNARLGRMPAHRGNMVGSWLGAVGAMTAALAVPARMIPTYAVAHPGGALAFTLSVVLATVVLVMLGGRLAAVVDTRALQPSTTLPGRPWMRRTPPVDGDEVSLTEGVGGAINVTAADIEASNGVSHVIDGVRRPTS